MAEEHSESDWLQAAFWLVAGVAAAHGLAWHFWDFDLLGQGTEVANNALSGIFESSASQGASTSVAASSAAPAAASPAPSGTCAPPSCHIHPDGTEHWLTKPTTVDWG